VVGGMVLNRAEEIAQRTVPMTAFDAFYLASFDDIQPGFRSCARREARRATLP
jgi:hypothetical protein